MHCRSWTVTWVDDKWRSAVVAALRCSQEPCLQVSCCVNELHFAGCIALFGTFELCKKPCIDATAKDTMPLDGAVDAAVKAKRG